MYSDVFCRVYNELGWNYYPEAFGEQLVRWLEIRGKHVKKALDLACGTGILCRVLHESGIDAMGSDLSEGMIRIAQSENPGIRFEVADMTAYCPEEKFDLVTCTGDALNHILEPGDVEQVFENVYRSLNEGGWFVFDLLDEREVSTSEPFELEFDENILVWFLMTRPEKTRVELKIRVFERGKLQFEEIIRERLHDPEWVVRSLALHGFRDIRCGHRLIEGEGSPAATWFVTARKGEGPHG